MIRRNQKGFTLIEVIVVAGIIAILAGILVPMIFSQIDESKKTRALSEAKSLQSTILAFKKDVGVWPGLLNATATDVPVMITADPTTLVASDSTQIGALGYSVSNLINIKDHLVDATAATAIYGKKWKGPYLMEVPVDPWGKPYIIPLEILNPAITANVGVPAYIFSAGPNGVFDTDRGAASLGGDDIGIRIQ